MENIITPITAILAAVTMVAAMIKSLVELRTAQLKFPRDEQDAVHDHSVQASAPSTSVMSKKYQIAKWIAWSAIALLTFIGGYAFVALPLSKLMVVTTTLSVAFALFGIAFMVLSKLF